MRGTTAGLFVLTEKVFLKKNHPPKRLVTELLNGKA